MKLATEDKCKTEYEDMKFRKNNARYLVYKIEKNETERIILERVGKKEETWDDFVASLPDHEYRFAVFDQEFTNSDNMNISKLLFVNWSPDDTPLKARMIYATAKEGFREYLDAQGKEVTLNSKKDLSEPELIKQLSK